MFRAQIFIKIKRFRGLKQNFSTLGSESFLSPKDIPPTPIGSSSISNDPIAVATFSNLSPSFLEAKVQTALNSQQSQIRLGPNLLKFSLNLNKLAEEGKLDDVVGRDKEIASTMQVLSRRRKNNPCLVGEPGVGKTSIAEGIALLIARGKAPAPLADKVVLSLDMVCTCAYAYS